MPSISLRAYNREIEAMIEHGQCDEAVAHCMHIMHSIPKYIGAYRLLGKALLELRRYADAADIFNRVLSSVPDDFVANIGMSIIRESEKNLNLAIWHMERAFESQPSNGVVQSELRRLYGRRDGFDPLKVRMTRGALARMYAKGNLYRQAIGELRAALAEDAQRTDLQILLAAMYFQSGQEVEAVNACNSVLRKSPYCLEANRIMAMILPKTERKDDARAYLQRIIALDPYFGKLRTGDFDVANAPDDAIQIERLSSQASQKMLQASSQPDWVASLGVAFDAPTTNQALPDWLTGEQKAVEDIPQIQEKEESAAEALEAAELPDWLNMPSADKTEEKTADLNDQDDSNIPDFLKDLGWEPSHANRESEESVFTEDAEEAEKGDVPDWLQSMVAEQDAKLLETGDSPPWLNEKQPGESDTIINWLGSKPVESTPEDLKSLEEALEKASAVNDAVEAAPTTGEEIALPDWLKEAGTGPAAAQSEDVPDWLKDLNKDDVQPQTNDIAASETIVAVPLVDLQPAELQSTEAQPAEEIPDWLKGLDKEDDTEPQIAIGLPNWSTDQALPVASEAFSETIIALPGADSQPAEVQPAEQQSADALPDWLKSLDIEKDTEPQQAVSAAELPAWEIEETSSAINEIQSETIIAPIEEESKPGEAQPAEDIPDWLKGLAMDDTEPQPAKAELPGWEPEQSVSSDGEIPQPDWTTELPQTAINGTSSETIIALPGVEDQPAEAQPVEDIPDWLKGLAMDNAEQQPDAADLPGWEQEQGQLPNQAVELPAWDFEQNLTAANESASETLFAAPVTEDNSSLTVDSHSTDALPADDIPDWLKNLSAEEDTEPQNIVPAAELPAWEFEQDLSSETAAASETIIAPIETKFQPISSQPAEAQPADETQPVEAIPDWLKGIASEDDTQPTIITQQVSAPETEQAVASESEPVSAVSAFNLDDPDAAMAWLESLAANQGVAQEQLTTRPEDRPETPEWLVEAGAQASERGELSTYVPTETTQPISDQMPEPVIAEHVSVEPVEPLPDTTPAVIAEEAEAVSDLPDWLRELEAEKSTTETDEPVGEIKGWVNEPIQPTVETAEDTQPADTAESETLIGMVEAAQPADDVPDWLKELQAETALEEPAAVQAEEKAVVSEVEPASAVSGFNLDDPDAAMAWLESLAANQGVAQDQLTTRPEDRPETPDWLVEAGAQASERGELSTYVPTETTMPQTFEQEEKPVDTGETPGEPVETEPAWLKAVEILPPSDEDTKPVRVQSVEPEVEVSAEEQVVETPAMEPVAEAPAEELAEIPDWLKSDEEESVDLAFIEPSADQPQELTETQLEEQTEEEIEIPEWMQPAESPVEKLDLNQVTLRELENLPGVGFVLASTILTQREVNGDYQYIEDLANVPGMDDQLFSILKEYLEVKQSPVRQTVIRETSPVPQVGDQNTLEEAFLDINQGEDETGASKLNGLIQRQVSLPEIIRGLQEAYARNTRSVFILQALGDAYMQDNQLQKALDSYIAAELLLR